MKWSKTGRLSTWKKSSKVDIEIRGRVLSWHRNSRNKWYEGTIFKVNKDGTYDVKDRDGNIVRNVKARSMRISETNKIRDGFTVGMGIQVRGQRIVFVLPLLTKVTRTKEKHLQFKARMDNCSQIEKSSDDDGLFFVYMTCPSSESAIFWEKILVGLVTKVAHTSNADEAQTLVARDESGRFCESTSVDHEVSWKLNWVRTRLRDFAGQMVYYDTHKWFVARRSLLVLVVDLCKAHDVKTRQRVCWWLRMIRHRTQNNAGKVESRVVLVGTHADKFQGDEGKESLQQASNGLVDAVRDAFGYKTQDDVHEILAGGQVYKVSSFTLVGIKKLAEHLQTILTDPNGFTLVGKVHPESYFELQSIAQELAMSGKPMVAKNELRAECLKPVGNRAVRAYLAESDAAFEAALQYLHDSGTALWFGEVDKLQDFVFVDPQWLTKLFAQIHMQKHKGKATLNTEEDWYDYELLINRGVLRLELLRKLWDAPKRYNLPHLLTKKESDAVKTIGMNTLVRLMCHFGAFCDVKLQGTDPSASRRLIRPKESSENKVNRLK